MQQQQQQQKLTDNILIFIFTYLPLFHFILQFLLIIIMMIQFNKVV
jgi:hypothetical protein